MRIFDTLSAEQLDKLDAMVKSDEDKDYPKLHNRIIKIKTARERDEEMVGEDINTGLDAVCNCKEETPCVRCTCHE